MMEFNPYAPPRAAAENREPNYGLIGCGFTLVLVTLMIVTTTIVVLTNVNGLLAAIMCFLGAALFLMVYVHGVVRSAVSAVGVLIIVLLMVVDFIVIVVFRI